MKFITLKNKDEIKLIKDVVMHPYKINEDASGVLVETLRKDWNDIYNDGREFFMQYYSETHQELPETKIYGIIIQLFKTTDFLL